VESPLSRIRGALFFCEANEGSRAARASSRRRINAPEKPRQRELASHGIVYPRASISVAAGNVRVEEL
jgi:hypothetical protein